VKIAYFIDNLRGDGTQRVLTQLVRGLAERGHIQKVLCLSDSYDETVVEELRSIRTEVRIVGKKALASGYGLISTTGWLKREKFDALVTMLFAADVIGRPLAKLAGVPRIISSLRARNIHYSSLQRWLVRFTMNAAHAVIINSPHSKDFAIDAEGAKPDRIFLIPNGVRVSQFTQPMNQEMLRNEFGLPRHGYLLGCVGRLTRQKGIDILLRALSNLSDREFHLVIFGTGRDQIQLQELTVSLGLESRVHFAGYRRDVPALLGALDLYVHPARFEGMPNAVLEAMAAACPIVATAVDGNRALINDGIDGWLVPPENADILATVIKEVLSNRSEARRRGLMAQKRATLQFSVDAMTTAWEKVLLGQL
jgi:glycosyltransferase involved in cell wall biosynthesis